MHTAVIVGPRSIELRRSRLPEPAPHEVRVRIEGTGVCGSNLPVWQGRSWFTYPLEPGAPGHEAWGTVDAAGDAVSHLKTGDRVALLSTHAYAEYDTAPADAVVPVPPALAGIDVPGEPLACAFNVFERSQIAAGSHVAVIGVGFLGALVVGLAHRANARVVAVSRRPFAREIARLMGADAAVPFDGIRPEEFDCVIEAVGSQQALDLAASLPKTRGRLVIAGYHQDGPRTVDLQSWNWRGIDVTNAHERDPERYVSGMRAAMALIASGELDVSPLLTHRVPLGRLPDAFQLLQDRPDGFMKALVMM